MKIIPAIIPRDLVTKPLLCFFCPFKSKTRIRFLTRSWFGNEKYFLFLFIDSCAILQSYGEFNRLL